jgi:glycosyltransferase involved in cell wall biosynthesis
MAARFVTVPNGISPLAPGPGREAVRAALGLAPDAIVFLTVGSLTKQKAQHVLLEGFARVAAAEPRARLLVAGDGPRQGELEALAGALGVAGRTTWLGLRTDAPDLLDACDVFVLSSEREGMPMSILEAMRAGRAVVTTRVGGTAEVVVEGVTGLLSPVGDAAALGEAMRATASDPARRAAFGAAGRARWSERFTAERMVRATEAVYRDALARGGKGAAVGAGSAA